MTVRHDDRRRVALLPLALVLLMGTPGCLGLFNQEFKEPEFDISDAYVMVLPFRQQRYWYGETAEGVKLANNIDYKIQEDCGATRVYSKDVVDRLQDSVTDPVPWRELGMMAEADYLVFGTINSLTLTKPNMVGMLVGELRCTLQVFNVERNLIEYERVLEVRYPKDPESGQIQVAFEQNEPQVKQKLLVLMAKKIHRLLCGWIRDKSLPDDI